MRALQQSAEPIKEKSDSAVLEAHYYRLTGRTFYRFNDIYLTIVVRRDEEAKWENLKTAHLIKELRKEGQTIWMRRK
jgi:hypothetical protein